MRRVSMVSAAVVALMLTGTALATPPAAAPSPARHAAEPARAAHPNILVWMIDDLGFGQLGAYGGLIDTPNIDRVAARGVRFANYHATPICSASRAAFLTGRNPHAVHMGSHAIAAVDQPGYDTLVPAGAGTLAENLRQAGYNTYAIGKWDHLRAEITSPAGPFTYWPSGQGFDHFYGYLAAETDQFSPILWSDHGPVRRPAPPAYHLSADLADRAIDAIDARDASGAAAPFFIYWATGAVHSPHQAPDDYLRRYRGRFDLGWDRAREQIFRRQKALGLIPADAVLPPRPEGMPAWDSLTPDEQRINARAMEAFAAMVTHADHEFGRILARLQERGELDNTIILITSDNGASAEGGPNGQYNAENYYNGREATVAGNLRGIETWGRPGSYPNTPVGWAVAGNTPFRYYKQTTYEGGVHVPLIIAGPGTADPGVVRRQYGDVVDLAPTLLAAAGVAPAERVNGVAQLPFDGISLASFLAEPAAPELRHAQYFELLGNRAIWADGWKAVLSPRLVTWQGGRPSQNANLGWELYDLRRDPTELNNLAAAEPDRLRRMIDQFDTEGRRNNLFPLVDAAGVYRSRRAEALAALAAHGGVWTYHGPVARIPEAAAPPLVSQSFEISARFEVPARASGALLAIGGHGGGFSLYVNRGVPTFIYRNMDGAETRIASPVPLGAGAHRLSLAFERQAEGGAQVRLLEGETVLAAGLVPGPLPSVRFSIVETMDIGSDSGSAAASDPAGSADFAGRIDEVSVRINQPPPAN